MQFRIIADHHMHGRSHRKDTTGYDRTAGINMSIATEHLREPFHHPLGNATMLFLSVTGQVAPVVLGIGKDQSHVVQYHLSRFRELVHTVSTTEHIIRSIKTLAILDIA